MPHTPTGEALLRALGALGARRLVAAQNWCRPCAAIARGGGTLSLIVSLAPAPGPCRRDHVLLNTAIGGTSAATFATCAERLISQVRSRGWGWGGRGSAAACLAPQRCRGCPP